MDINKMTFGKMIGYGFSVIIVLLFIVGAVAYFGVGGIVKNAGEVIDGNALNALIIQKEVDHLNWARKVNSFISDDSVTELNVETNDHLCGLGKWLYSDARRKAERLIPSISPLLSRLEKSHKALHNAAKKIKAEYRVADLELPAFLSQKISDHLKWAAKIDHLFLNNQPSLDIQTDSKLCRLGKWLYGDSEKTIEQNPEFAPVIAELKIKHKIVHESAKKIQNQYIQIHPGLEVKLLTIINAHRKWVNSVLDSIINMKEINVEVNPANCVLGHFLNSEETMEIEKNFSEFKSIIEEISTPHTRLHNSAIDINKAIKAKNRSRARLIYIKRTKPAITKVVRLLQKAIDTENILYEGNLKAIKTYHNETLPALNETQRLLNNLVSMAEKKVEARKVADDIYVKELIPALTESQTLFKEIKDSIHKNIMTDDVMLSSAQHTRLSVVILSIVAFFIGIFLAYYVARLIVRVLKRIAFQMMEGADQVAAASAQVSNASQQLAEGASEQAASIEESSSSLEEMSSMTKQNADNSGQADLLMKETINVIEKANESMDKLTDSMGNITKASDETSKIIKTIDEIAFQTNLLALNAAVEAARAGEAGAGFAVVADEVRNLAMRAAEAAKNTSSLIEGTKKEVFEGAEIVKQTGEAFSQVTNKSTQVSDLVSEISAASSEQAEGIGQINRAIIEMDRVTQQNAANAEESASASEEMNAQAEQMRVNVEELTQRVTGLKVEKKHKEISSLYQNPVVQTQKTHKTKIKPAMIQNKSKDDPEKVFPMNDDDFEDF